MSRVGTPWNACFTFSIHPGPLIDIWLGWTKSVSKVFQVIHLFHPCFLASGRARVRARLTRGRVILPPVSVPVHGGPYSLRSEAFLGRSFSTRAALPIIEEYKGAFPRSRALSGRRRGSLG